jgi:hypothetical protein
LQVAALPFGIVVRATTAAQTDTTRDPETAVAIVPDATAVDVIATAVDVIATAVDVILIVAEVADNLMSFKKISIETTLIALLFGYLNYLYNYPGIYRNFKISSVLLFALLKSWIFIVLKNLLYLRNK